MKKAAISCLVMVSIFGFLAHAMSSGPVGVSPGGGTGDAVVGSAFPTFSWSAVEGAVGYRLEIFKGVEGAPSHEEMTEKGELVMRVEISAPALSWTPSAMEALQTGESYVWYIKASDSNEEGQWSPGNRFRIDASFALSGMDEAVKEKVREYVKTDTEIRTTIREIKEEGSTQAGAGAIAVGTGESPEAVKLKGTEGEEITSYGKDAGTTGSNNTFIGRSAGLSNTTGYWNTFLGRYAGALNTTGYHNTFLGSNAGYSNTTGYRNTFLGSNAGALNTIGNTNTFLGYYAGYSNTTACNNTFVGYYAGNLNTTGTWNTFLGRYAGALNTTGYHNTFLGHDAGHSNTTGYYNTFMGSNAGPSNTTGYYNTFLGFNAGYSNTTGYRNTFLGYYAGYSNTEGGNNVFVGYKAGYNETGAHRLYIHNSDSSSPLIYGEFDNCIVKINGSLNIADVSSPSDISLKKDIQPLDRSLEKITSLRGVSFRWKTDENPDRGLSKERQIGLVAQDVEKVLPELVRTDKDGKKSLAYDKLTSVLVEAIKAQQVRMENQQAEIQELKAMITKLAAKAL